MTTANNAALENLFNTAIEGANSTKMNLLPPGDYKAQISKVTPPEVIGENNNVGFKVFFQILDAENPDEVYAPLNAFVFLDLTPQMTLDMGEGKNVQLGRIREACDMNDPSKPFTFQNLLGSVVKVTVVHQVSKKSGETNAQVKRILKDE